MSVVKVDVQVKVEVQTLAKEDLDSVCCATAGPEPVEITARA
ncbi:hypothetical protein [Nonomuraea sediminis]|nr:hypothetical protein [Nonomuraea sediminis]